MKPVKNWYCPECKRAMTLTQAKRSMRNGCPNGCSGIDIYEIPTIDLMKELAKTLAARGRP